MNADYSNKKNSRVYRHRFHLLVKHGDGSLWKFSSDYFCFFSEQEARSCDETDDIGEDGDFRKRYETTILESEQVNRAEK